MKIPKKFNIIIPEEHITPKIRAEEKDKEKDKGDYYYAKIHYGVGCRHNEQPLHPV